MMGELGPKEYIGIAGLVVTFGAGVWGIVRYFLIQDRKLIDAQIKAAFERVDELQTQIDGLQLQFVRMEESSKQLPNRIEIQDWLDKRLDRLTERIEQLMAEMHSHFLGCPTRDRGKFN